MAFQTKGKYLITIMGKDRVGVVSAVSNCLFDTGANLADSTFAVLGEGFEFSCVAEFEAKPEIQELESELGVIDVLDGATVSVREFPFQLLRGETGKITHTVEITGGDRPGLVARMSDVLVEYGANIVRMSSHRTVVDGGFEYRTRFAVNTERGRLEALENALSNTAGSLRLECSVKSV